LRLTNTVNSPLTLRWHAECDDEIGAARAYSGVEPPAAWSRNRSPPGRFESGFAVTNPLMI
jgi:hypothetical protein